MVSSYHSRSKIIVLTWFLWFLQHGVRRSKVTPESLEARRQKEASKITEYRTTVDELLDRVSLSEPRIQLSNLSSLY